MRCLRFAAVALLVSGVPTLSGQTPAFDAASVRRATQPGGFMGRQPGGRFTAAGVSLQDLIVFAYNVQPYQIVGGPRWLRCSDRRSIAQRC
jgi:uncharacterized protein (TIGR03435 family)